MHGQTDIKFTFCWFVLCNYISVRGAGNIKYIYSYTFHGEQPIWYRYQKLSGAYTRNIDTNEIACQL